MDKHKHAQKSIDSATRVMLTKAEKDSVEVAWDRFKNRNPNAVSDCSASAAATVIWGPAALILRQRSG